MLTKKNLLLWSFLLLYIYYIILSDSLLQKLKQRVKMKQTQFKRLF